MRSRAARSNRRGARRGGNDAIDRRNPPLFVLQALGWSPRDAVGFLVVGFAAIAILVNVLFLQSGTHPAPMFKSVVIAATPSAKQPAAVLPRPRPAVTGAAKPEPRPAARSSTEIVSDIQRELARRGFYDGAVDGRYGPKTDTAVRDFEQAAGLRSSTEPNEPLLAAIARSNVKSARATTASTSARAAAPPVRNDPIAQILSPSKRIVAVQRALAEYGYGQIKPTGVVDPETRAAIEKFERERKLPITGQVSDRVARELASLTGRPLD